MRAILLFFSLTLSILHIFASEYTVSGTVADIAGEAESFATIKIYTMADTVNTSASGLADTDGRFKIELPSVGDYRLCVTAVGKETLSKDFSVGSANKAIDLGTLVLNSSESMLREVTVMAQRPLVSKEIDRIGYDVQADEESKTSPIIDILRKVPLVVVQPDGTILVNGSSNYKIYRNGRPNSSYSQNAQELFKSIPASTIKKIEVITDPGAREDAEGVGAILNIVTMENTSLKGVSGNLSVSSNTIDWLPSQYSAFITTQVGKFTISPYAGIYSSRHRKASEVVGDVTYDATGDRSLSESLSKNKIGQQYWGFDSSLEIDTLNLVTLEYSGSHVNFKGFGTGRLDMLTAAGASIYSYENRETNSTDYDNHTMAANYQRSTRLKGETVTLSYQFSYNKSTSGSETHYTNTVNFPVPYDGILNDGHSSTAEHTVQLDWSRPLGKVHTLDLGGKYIHRHASSVNDIEYTGMGGQHTEFAHNTEVAAAYADWRAKIGRLGLRAGVRYEYSRLAGEYKSEDKPEFSSTFNDLVPNLSANFDINDANTVKFGYSMRIARPGINTLNPAVQSTPNQVSSGNPYLESAKYHSLSANYSYIKPKLNIDLSASYRFCNDGIEQAIHTVDNVVYETYENIGKTRELNFGGYVQWMLSEKSSLSFNGSLSYNKYRSPGRTEGVILKNQGFSGYGYARFTYNLPWKLRGIVGLSYWSGGIFDVYSEYSSVGMYALDHTLSLQRSFLDQDRLTVLLSVSNPFGPYSGVNKNKMFNAGITGENRFKSYNNSYVQLRLSYRFGSLQAYVKKTKGISNDDSVPESDKGGKSK